MLDESSNYENLEVKGFQNTQVEWEIKVKQLQRSKEAI
jgi:hypothetical protein